MRGERMAKRPSRKKPAPQASGVADDEEILKNATGSKIAQLQNRLIDDVYRTLWLPEGLTDEQRQNILITAFCSLQEIAPEDGVEGMLATQMVASHSAAIECWRRAMLPEQTIEGRDLNLKNATKLSSLYVQQMTALDKHRGKGQQKVTVEHVNVEAGGQAIVGNVETRADPRAPATAASADVGEIENYSEVPFDAGAERKTRVPRRR